MSWFVNEFAKEVWEKKYKGNSRDIHEYFSGMAAMLTDKYENRFWSLFELRHFLPGGRIMALAGRQEASVSAMNCTTHTVEGDSLDAIASTIKTIMKASSKGQGIGVNLSKLRPRGSAVNNAAKTSTGAISFMELFAQVGATIGQDGRRAALLFSLDVDHPDLWREGENDIECPNCRGKGCTRCRGKGYLPYDFLNIKKVSGKVENANISVNITDAFMRAVKADEPWQLSFKGESGSSQFSVSRTVSAKRLFKALCSAAWQAAEPGVLFKDTSARMSNSDLFGQEWAVTGVNACSEQVLEQDGVCNLGSINLASYVEEPFGPSAKFNMDNFINDVKYSVLLLDNVLTKEVNERRSSTERQRETILALRRVGLGIMGLGDLLAMAGLPYDPENAKTAMLVASIMEQMRNAAYAASVDLAKTYGPCEVWKNTTEAERASLVEQGFYKTLPRHLKDAIVKYGLRNTVLLSVAPTGSISNILGVTSGIEPLFARSYTRRVLLGGEEQTVEYTHPGVVKSRQAGMPDSIWQTAYEVTPRQHVLMQALIQKYVDASISKTVNMPENSTIEDVMDIYMLAWESGLKGIAVYRENSRDSQILTTREPEEEEVCPNCGGDVIHNGGCTECPSCGWGKCG